ncbi:MAG: hypothetical protein LBO82_05370 [Synergistaceae bacterium]|nr:hypothetical protein [Synergistaceae bacterium]
MVPYLAARPDRQEGWNCFTEDGHGAMRGGKILFLKHPDGARSADWLFAADVPDTVFVTNVPKERRIVFLMEPPAIRKYSAGYLDQFGVAVSPYEIKDYSGRAIISNPCLGWFAGISTGSTERLDWFAETGTGETKQAGFFFEKLQDVREYKPSAKSRTISIIVSLKNLCEGHAKRLAFLEALKAHCGAKVDYYGREFNAVDDKLEAIAPYKYHIAIENSQMENYWTEKLTDAWIGWSLPIYCGDSALRDRIPDPMGIEIIDINDIPSSLKKIDDIVENDIYESRLEAIKKCRDWVIAESNPYEKVSRIIESADSSVIGIPKLRRGILLRPAVNWCHISYFVFKFLSLLFNDKAWIWYLAYKEYKNRRRIRLHSDF